MTLFLLIFIALIVWFYLFISFKKADIFTLLIISYLLSFDLLSIAYVYKKENIDDFVSFLLLFYIFFSVFLITFICKTFLKKQYLEYVSFKIIIEKANLISDKITFLFFIIASSVILYYFSKYNLIFRVAEYKQMNILKTYGIIIGSFVLPIYTMLIIILMSKLLNKYNKYKLFYLSCLIIIMLYFLFYGRREFIIGLLLIALTYSIIKNSNLFSIKKIPLVILSFFIIIIASNFYQNVRFQIAAYAVTKKFDLKKSVYEYAFDFDSSGKTIENRMSIYDYTYTIIYKIMIEGFSPLYGDILSQGFINTIPSIIYSDKKVIDDDDLVNHTLKLPNKDMPNSIAGNLFVDFGLLAYLIFPLFMSTYIIISIIIIYKYRDNPILYILLISMMFYFIFNVETGMTSIFVNLRNMVITIIIMQTIYHLKNFRKN